MPPLSLPNIATRAAAYAQLPSTSEAVKKTCDVVAATARAQATDEYPLNQIEAQFLQSLDLSTLIGSLGCEAVWQWLHDLVVRRFTETVMIAPASPTSGRRSRRVGSAIVQRMVELDFIEDIDAVQIFVTQHAASERLVEATMAANIAAADRVIASVASPVAGAGSSASGAAGARVTDSSGAAGPPRSNFNDPTRNRRAVQYHFSDTGSDELRKFTGDLSKPPPYKLWERRYRTLVRNMDIDEREKVLFLSEALAGPALTFFYEKICPDDARSGNSLSEAATAATQGRSAPVNLAPNSATMSGALRLLEDHFCTESARNVLKQDLDQLKLSTIEAEERVSKPKALVILKEMIQQLSANGLPEYDSETCMITALRNSLHGELWAVEPLINASDRASKSPENKTLEHYTQTLVSYLRTRETLSQSPGTISSNTSVVPSLFSDVYYGDSRAAPRKSRATYRRGAPVRFSPMSMMQKGAGTRPNANGDNGAFLGMRQLLNEPPRRTVAQPYSMDGHSRRQKGTCWNCDQPGHLMRDCSRPKRPRAQIARAMLMDEIPVMEVAVWLSHETSEMEIEAVHDHGNEVDGGANENVEETAADMEEQIQTFDTLFSALSRENAPAQIFQ